MNKKAPQGENQKLSVMTREEFYAEAEKRFGKNKKDWAFVCPWCQFIQSMNSILSSIAKNGKHTSMRYGEITLENISVLQPQIEQECLAANCNYASYGLFGGSLEVDGHRYLELAQLKPSN